MNLQYNYYYKYPETLMKVRSEKQIKIDRAEQNRNFELKVRLEKELNDALFEEGDELIKTSAFSQKELDDNALQLVKDASKSAPVGGPAFKSIVATVEYPGFRTGIGLPHELGSKYEGELKGGFAFDYVTGQPYLPGSSLKGALRSAFAQPEYVAELLTDILKANNRQLPSAPIMQHWIKAVELHIFDGGLSFVLNIKEHQVEIQELSPMSCRDIFLDGFPDVAAEGKVLLADDYTTPHRQNKELLELAAPVPIRHLRVKPQVKFCFGFLLSDAELRFKGYPETFKLTADDKLNLFKAIIGDLGLGARTNLGYGQFKDIMNAD